MWLSLLLQMSSSSSEIFSCLFSSSSGIIIIFSVKLWKRDIIFLEGPFFLIALPIA